MTAVSVRGLTKRFGHITAVNDLSFDVTHGTITGFLGPNGAGKTTTLRMLLGLVHPTAATTAGMSALTRHLSKVACRVSGDVGPDSDVDVEQPPRAGRQWYGWTRRGLARRGHRQPFVVAAVVGAVVAAVMFALAA